MTAPTSVFSICGMCSVRCPVEATTQNGNIIALQGNPHSALKGALCPRGAAGPALENDPERPQTPLIRTGKRGEGQWKIVSWDEAFAYIATKLERITAEHGSRSVLWSDRGGPFTDLHQAFVRGLGTPNYCNHDAACARNVQHGARSVIGIGRKEVAYDFKNTKHIILQTRNILEAVNVAEANAVLDGLANGAKLTVIDIRGTVSASKADNFFLIRPGSDYAFNLGVIHTLITENLYNASFVEKFVTGFAELQQFILPYSAEWAAAETGVHAESIRDLAHQLSHAAPEVIWHPGWMVARYNSSFLVCRTAYIINALLGSIGCKGGLPFVNTPKDVGRKGLKKLADLYPKPQEKRADGVGWQHQQFDAGPGLVNLAYDAIATENPYPVKAYLCFRHDPLMSFPDPEALKKKWENLDLLVSMTFSWSDTAWHSDVVLPLSTYLARESIIASKSGLKPQFFVRKRAQNPHYDSRADWEILCGLAKHLGLEKLAFEHIEDIWKYQLEGTGVGLEDFTRKGFVELADGPLYRNMEDVSLPTPSEKIEIFSQKWAKAGLESLPLYTRPDAPPPGMFRLTFGRCVTHTQGHTVNNPWLSEQLPENRAWIHPDRAAELDVHDDELVEIFSAHGATGRIRLFVTECIHPEALFLLHGFGHRLPVESRAQAKGAADQELLQGGLEVWDKGGGCVSMQEHFVGVRRLEETS